MTELDQIFDVINQLRSSAENLNKDIDHNDSREETRGDLEQFSSGFQQLQHFFSKIDQQDISTVQREVQEWLSGKQDFQQYARDVVSLVSDIRNRTEADGKVQQKIQENMPEQHRDRNIGDFFNEIKGVLDQVQNLTGAGR